MGWRRNAGHRNTAPTVSRTVPLVAAVPEPVSFRLAELLGVLSLGADLGMGQPMEHGMRQCVIAGRMGEQLGLSEAELGVIYYSTRSAARSNRRPWRPSERPLLPERPWGHERGRFPASFAFFSSRFSFSDFPDFFD